LLMTPYMATFPSAVVTMYQAIEFDVVSFQH